MRQMDKNTTTETPFVKAGAGYRAPAAILVIALLLGRASGMRNELWTDAIELWKDASQKSPAKARCYNNLGVAFEAAGEANFATAAYRLALRMNDRYADARNNLGVVFNKMDLLEAAIKESLRALDIAPGMPEAHLNLGTVYMKQGRLDEAIAEYEEAVRLKPQNPEALNNLGLAYRRSGQAGGAEGVNKIAKAVRAHREAIALDPASYTAMNNLGNALTILGLTDEAIVEYRKMLAIKPDFSEGHNNLANALVLSAKSGEGNKGSGPKGAITGTPAEAGGDTIINKAIVEAIAEYKRALELKPGYVDARFNLAVVYLRNGMKEDATREFGLVLKARPWDEEAKRGLEEARQGMNTP